MTMNAKLKAASNQADWATPIQFLDRLTGTLVDLSDCDFTIALAASSPPPDAPYRGFYGYGNEVAVSNRRPVLMGSTDTGEITVAGPGMIMVYFPVDRMRSLPPGNYKVGLTVQTSGRTWQVLIGYLPVRDGVVWS